MAQTVIGIFDHVAEADNALERLTNSGFDRGLIDLSINKTGAERERNVSEEELPDEDAFGERVNLFFRSLFRDKQELDKFSSAARLAEAVISVQTDNDNEATHVAQIMDECGAIDVDGRVKSFHSATPNTLRKNAKPGDGNSMNMRSDQIEGDSKRPGNREIQNRSSKTRSRIVQRPVDESLRLREERVKVDPNPVEKEVTEGLYDFANKFPKRRKKDREGL